jgi:hypothetical protein
MMRRWIRSFTTAFAIAVAGAFIIVVPSGAAAQTAGKTMTTA